jgi:hypothetical protein
VVRRSTIIIWFGPRKDENSSRLSDWFQVNKAESCVNSLRDSRFFNTAKCFWLPRTMNNLVFVTNMFLYQILRPKFLLNICSHWTIELQWPHRNSFMCLVSSDWLFFLLFVKNTWDWGRGEMINKIYGLCPQVAYTGVPKDQWGSDFSPCVPKSADAQVTYVKWHSICITSEHPSMYFTPSLDYVHLMQCKCCEHSVIPYCLRNNEIKNVCTCSV